MLEEARRLYPTLVAEGGMEKQGVVCEVCFKLFLAWLLEHHN